MKSKSLIYALIFGLIAFLSCEKDDAVVIKAPSAVDVTLVADEVISDIDFAEMLDEGDDGLFWRDMMLKSTEITEGTCPNREVVREDNVKIVTLEFSGEDCGKGGTIIIEHFKPDQNSDHKKKVTYIDFIKNGITHNGVKEIVKGADNILVDGTMEIDKINSEGDSVHIVRDFKTQVYWLCGLDTPNIKEDNIRKVTGQTDVARTVNGETKSFTRKILEPLLIVSDCEMKIQAGSVKVERANGDKLTIDYGLWPDEIDCDSDFECDNKFTVTKDGETYNMELVDGKRVKVEDSEE